MVDAARPRREIARFYGDQLRGSAVAIPIGEAVDLVADADAGGSEAQAGDDAGQFVTGNDRRSIVAAAIDPCRRPLQLSRRIARGVYLDERVAGAGLGRRSGLADELVGASAGVDAECSHRSNFMLCSAV